jgi:hypothetical protein
MAALPDHRQGGASGGIELLSAIRASRSLTNSNATLLTFSNVLIQRLSITPNFISLHPISSPNFPSPNSIVMVNVLIIGATRGLGAALANAYAKDSSNTVFGTTRSSSAPSDEKYHKAITWVPHIDLMNPGVGAALVNQLGMLGVSGGMVEGGVKHFDAVVCPSHTAPHPTFSRNNKPPDHHSRLFCHRRLRQRPQLGGRDQDVQ